MVGREADGETTLLFVYGTLRRGGDHPMARLLALRAHYLGPARMAGRLYRLGSYPGLVRPRRPQEWVNGDLYDLAQAPGLLARLDRYEGLEKGRKAAAEYRRLALPALLADGTRHEAWVYLYRRPVERLPRLVSGDFLRQHRRPPQR